MVHSTGNLSSDNNVYIVGGKISFRFGNGGLRRYLFALFLQLFK